MTHSLGSLAPVNIAREDPEAFAPTDYLIELGTSPVSFQGSQPARRSLETRVREAAARPGVLLTGEVAIEIEWFLHEKLKWESPNVLSSPDLDNILKPIIDGLCGPTRLLIDDCQIQSIACNWIDWPSETEQKFTIRARPNLTDDRLHHQTLTWIDMGDGLCWPIPSSLDAGAQLFLVQRFEEALERRRQFLEFGVSEYQAGLLMPIQRRFHRARLQKHGFIVAPVADYKMKLSR